MNKQIKKKAPQNANVAGFTNLLNGSLLMSVHQYVKHVLDFSCSQKASAWSLMMRSGSYSPKKSLFCPQLSKAPLPVGWLLEKSQQKHLPCSKCLLQAKKNTLRKPVSSRLYPKLSPQSNLPPFPKISPKISPKTPPPLRVPSQFLSGQRIPHSQPKRILPQAT